MSRKIVVTGGAGFLGSYVPDWARRHDFEAVPFDNRPDVARGFGLDVVERDDVEHGIPEDTYAVIHLAGVLGTSELFDDPHDAIDVNIHGALNVIERCTAIGAKYIGISMPPVFTSVYTATKLCSMRLATAWYEHRGLKTAHVCAYNAFGPGQAHGPGHPQKIIPTFAVKAWRNEPIPVWGDGMQTVDLVHARDVARMLVDAVRIGGEDEEFEAGTGVPITVNEVAEFVNKVAGSTAGIEYLPMRDGERPTHIVASGANVGIDWRPEFSWDEIAETVKAYQEIAAGPVGR